MSAGRKRTEQQLQFRLEGPQTTPIGRSPKVAFRGRRSLALLESWPGGMYNQNAWQGGIWVPGARLHHLYTHQIWAGQHDVCSKLQPAP